jgi:hypothetical protein
LTDSEGCAVGSATASLSDDTACIHASAAALAITTSIMPKQLFRFGNGIIQACFKGFNSLMKKKIQEFQLNHYRPAFLSRFLLTSRFK